MEQEDLIAYGTVLAASAVFFLAMRNVPRTKGTKVVNHFVFILVSGLTLYFLPEFIQNILFSKEGVLIIGTIFPIYESIRAVVSIEKADDVAWVEFWIASGTFTYCTEWMDVVAEQHPHIAEHWYEFEFLALLWFILPFTDGSTLMFDNITRPIFGAMFTNLKQKMDRRIALIVMVVNWGHLWVLWMTFTSLDEEARRFIVVAVGTVYPIIASTVACTTTTDEHDDSFWLTYWASFSIVFMMMDYLENFVGKITGFYSLCLCATVYLFLPMFNGADAVFRNILAPLSGQYEAMLLRDVHILKVEILKKIPERKRDSFLKQAASLFVEKKTKSE